MDPFRKDQTSLTILFLVKRIYLNKLLFSFGHYLFLKFMHMSKIFTYDMGNMMYFSYYKT